ncbi:MAG: hybrid sensor histidine kinase/response regulator [Alphaproteobacteria bacterium]
MPGLTFRDARIFVIAPEAQLVELRAILHHEGVDAVETVGDPATALDAMAVFRPDLVLYAFDPAEPDGMRWLKTIEAAEKEDCVSVLVIGPPFDRAEITERMRSMMGVRLRFRALAEENARIAAELRQTQAKHEEARATLKQAEERLTAALQESEGKSRAKSEFIANMSHELRTPLNAIIGFSEILRDQTFGPHGNPKYGEYAANIHEASSHLLGLINDILDISRAEAGQLDLTFETIDARSTIASAVRMLDGTAKTRGVKLKIEIAPDFPHLRTDERRLRQVLLNLISNAIKFTPRNGLVTVRADVDPADGAFIIVVSDTGIGIDPKDIPIIMSRYGQVKGQTANPDKGAGLGLPLTEKIVKALGGQLEVRSRKGVGTAVTVRFPPDLIVRP